MTRRTSSRLRPSPSSEASCRQGDVPLAQRLLKIGVEIYNVFLSGVYEYSRDSRFGGF